MAELKASMFYPKSHRKRKSTENNDNGNSDIRRPVRTCRTRTSQRDSDFVYYMSSIKNRLQMHVSGKLDYLICVYNHYENYAAYSWKHVTS